MPNIVSSVFQSFTQKDGSKTVHEIHTDLVGMAHDLVYQASAAEDLNANLTSHASDLGNSLDSGEVSANIGSIMTLGANAVFTLIYSTVPENVAALRAAYASAIQAQAVLIGDFLNTLTDVQLQNAFGLTPSQVTTLRNTKLIPAASLATALRASTGA